MSAQEAPPLPLLLLLLVHACMQLVARAISPTLYPRGAPPLRNAAPGSGACFHPSGVLQRDIRSVLYSAGPFHTHQGGVWKIEFDASIVCFCCDSEEVTVVDAAQPCMPVECAVG